MYNDEIILVVILCFWKYFFRTYVYFFF